MNKIRAAWNFAVVGLLLTSGAALGEVTDNFSDSELTAHVRIDWTLNESGRVQRDFGESAKFHRCEMIQLFQPPFEQTNPSALKGIPSDSFGKALKYAKQKRIVSAEIEFEKALNDAHGLDPLLMEFIASEYSKVLKQKGDFIGADKLIAKYRVANTKSVTISD